MVFRFGKRFPRLVNWTALYTIRYSSISTNSGKEYFSNSLASATLCRRTMCKLPIIMVQFLSFSNWEGEFRTSVFGHTFASAFAGPRPPKFPRTQTTPITTIWKNVRCMLGETSGVAVSYSLADVQFTERQFSKANQQTKHSWLWRCVRERCVSQW